MLSLKFYSPDVFELCEDIASRMQKNIKFSLETQKFWNNRTQTTNTSIRP